MTLEFSDLDLIKSNALRTFDERISGAGDDRQAIERETFRLESQLEQLYSFTAALARREDDMARTAELWDRLVKTCDIFAGKIFSLSQEHSLGTTAYDHVLDIRSAAQELRALHSP